MNEMCEQPLTKNRRISKINVFFSYHLHLHIIFFLLYKLRLGAITKCKYFALKSTIQHPSIVAHVETNSLCIHYLHNRYL